MPILAESSSVSRIAVWTECAFDRCLVPDGRMLNVASEALGKKTLGVLLGRYSGRRLQRPVSSYIGVAC